MRVTDLSAPASAAGPTAQRPVPAAPPRGAAPESRAELEMALLRARVAHLEAVLETARGLMTSNQERLLRRLYEVPDEIASLSARLNGFVVSSAPGASPGATRVAEA